jgi:diaminohydroxyphosphoribosylaminopyrimidine deaminase/5-amino-6-(5-phosphoribosylamino)uracil reductase
MTPGDWSDDDRRHMARALGLAERGLYTTTPNPPVGCVIVREGRVVGEGWHEFAGGPHAEIAALADASSRGEAVRGATLYVTLEPCSHAGRTPPCADAVAAAGIARVVVAMRDPNPLAADGATKLAAAGLAVEVGLLADEARALNPGFVARVTRGRPWVRMKSAASLDGRTALPDGTSRWITGEAARADGHAWRARACAVLTGIGTVLSDDPALTVRAVGTSRQPRRIVVDRHGETPPGAKVLDGGAIVVTAGARNPDWPSDVEHVVLPDAAGRVDLAGLMRELARREFNEIHVEAGNRLNGALLAAGLVDELLLYLAPSLLGDPAFGIAAFDDPQRSLERRVRLGFGAIDRIGDDLRVIARVRNEGSD